MARTPGMRDRPGVIQNLTQRRKDAKKDKQKRNYYSLVFFGVFA